MGICRHPLFLDPGHLARLPVDANLVARLRTNFERVAARGTALAEAFYRRLFAAHPELRPLFPSDMSQQHLKLLATLRAVMDELDQPDAVAPRLLRLGHDHVGYGAKPEHYPIVCEHLAEAMREVGGGDLEVRSDWLTALQRVSAAMLRGTAAP